MYYFDKLFFLLYYFLKIKLILIIKNPFSRYHRIFLYQLELKS